MLEEETKRGGKCPRTRHQKRKKLRPDIRSKRGLVSADALRARIEATGLSKRQIARVVGLNDLTIRAYLGGRIQIPEWMSVAMMAIELQQAIVALLAETPPSGMTPRRKLMAIVERFVPPPPKSPAPAKPKRVAKPPKPPVKPRKKLFKVKSYDASVKYQPAPEPEHPLTSGFRTLALSVGGKR